MANHTTDYLIIGNSAAGVTAAEAIRATDVAGSILIVSNEPYPVYGTPLISYLIEGKTSEEQLGFKDDDFYEEHGFDTLLGPDYEVTALDATAHTATLADGDVITYGKCLIATGSVPFTPPIAGLEGRSNVYPFMTLDDAKAARDAALSATERAHADNRQSTVVVIGAGLIGLKAAESLFGYVDEVRVLELAPRILPNVMDDEGAAVLVGQLAARGIECTPGITADELVGEGDVVTSLKLTDGTTLACDMVIAAVGVRPNSALAVAAGAEQGRGLVCGTDLQTTLADVYAAGDVTQVNDSLSGAKRPLALWPNAMRQGRIAGQNMAAAADAERFEGNFAVNAVDFFDISLLTAGIINPPEDDGFEVETTVEGDTYAKFVTKDDCLYGYILLNRPDRAGIYTALIDRAVPLSTLDEGIFDAEPENLEFNAAARWARLHKFYPSERDEYGWKERA